MKNKYLIGIILIIIFVIIAISAFDDSKIEYAEIDKAISSQKVVQIIGSWVKEKGTEYNSDANEFIFYLKDESNKEIKVIFNGAEPNNFKIAPMVVVKGKYSDEAFQAKQILTKCPSKYEGTKEELLKS